MYMKKEPPASHTVRNPPDLALSRYKPSAIKLHKVASQEPKLTKQ